MRGGRRQRQQRTGRERERETEGVDVKSGHDSFIPVPSLNATPASPPLRTLLSVSAVSSTTSAAVISCDQKANVLSCTRCVLLQLGCLQRRLLPSSPL